MSILLLSQGDEAAKNLLRNVIAAHYGERPTAFESVHMKTKGYVFQSIGKFNIKLSIDVDIRFQIPTQMRIDFQIRFLNISLYKRSTSFDGKTYYEKSQNQPIKKTTTSDTLATTQQQLWSYATMLLMPLNETHVELHYDNEVCLQAYNTQTGLSSTMHLYDDSQLQQIIVQSEGQQPTLQLNMSHETFNHNGIKAFKQIDVYIGEKCRANLYPAEIHFVDKFDNRIFQLT